MHTKCKKKTSQKLLWSQSFIMVLETNRQWMKLTLYNALHYKCMTTMLGESYLIFLFKIFNLDLSIVRVSFLFEIKLTNPLPVKRIVTFLKWTAFRVLSVPSIVQTHVIFLPSLHPSLIFRYHLNTNVHSNHKYLPNRLSCDEHCLSFIRFILYLKVRVFVVE